MLNGECGAARGLYDPAFEHDACGVGFVADLAGRRRHDVLARGLEAAARLSHRGAMDADAQSSDGAGVTTQIPVRLFAPLLAAAGCAGPLDLAVGMCFFPQAPAEARRAQALFEAQCRQDGLVWLGWREVPVAPGVLGARSRAAMPTIAQALVARPRGCAPEAFERALLLARKAFESAVVEAGLEGVYVCSFSSRAIVYKGLLSAAQLPAFYPDLRDPAYETAICLFHQRYSTNTFPTWPLAQPFRLVAHNGEINTVAGNRHWMSAREPGLEGGGWSGAALARLRPVIQPGGSDSAALDNALELLVASGRSLPHALAMLMPEAYEHAALMADDVRAFYEYHQGLMEPWDGPAAVAFCDGERVGARLDRNGLRPARWCLTHDGLVVLGSEAGMLEFEPADIAEKGRLGPGEMLLVDTAEGRLYRPEGLMAHLAARRPYRTWLEAHQARIGPVAGALVAGGGSPLELARRQTAFGYTLEDVERVIAPMAVEGKEPVGSMGDDTPLAIFSAKPRPLYHYFRQRFAQVTNPPIDPLREKLNMSLTTWLGPRRSLLGETPEHARLLRLASPVLTDGELAYVRAARGPGFRAATLDATWNALEGEGGLSRALERLRGEAVAAARGGCAVLVVSDRRVGKARVGLPMLLAVAALHRHLVELGLRMRLSLVAESGEPREDHHLACLIGYGADAVNPYLALATAGALGAAGGGGAREVLAYKAALESGLRKIMAKMGVSTIGSYRGAQLFEAIGLDAELVARLFPGTPAPVGGLGLDWIAHETMARHAEAYGGEAPAKLADWGLHRYRVGGEYHAFAPGVFKALQQAARSGQADDYRGFAAEVGARPPVTLRDRLVLRPAGQPVPLDEVEPASAIASRFAGAAMSMGALSAEAHACVAIALNRLGAKSNSGEGGEDATRFVPLPNGDSANSAIKQVASGRFGVTPGYLVSAQELEIKMAQGSKPGEGGQLPGNKVVAEIARLRHATPGTPLISPPPHHDIYSIEDLAQLIFDLKRVHPEARVAVKLVSEAGVGTIAAGVAKAHADVLHLSGHDGGTGASPLGSIKYAGAPWELGLAELQQVLVMNDLRGRLRVRVDGGLKTGRDVLVAALLGAEEYGFGTPLLVAAGCVMIRQCHHNTCPTGIATQDPKLRGRFKGTPENIVHYLLGVAEEVRELLAGLGLRSLDEAIGRVDLLTPAPALAGKAEGLDLSRLLVDPDPSGLVARRRHQPLPTPTAPGLDDRVLEAFEAAIASHGEVEWQGPIRNVDRAVGARVAGAVARRWGDTGFRGRLVGRFEGAAGQSFGAFCLEGLAWHLVGEANDYVGKGAAGGLIVVMPPPEAGWETSKSPIVGNTVLYGATGGRLFAAGRAGERFAVRNSGATAVVEGLGDHGCEYMTGGTVAVLGVTGRNFAAGMTGGVAYVWDEDGLFAHRCNRESVTLDALDGPEDAEALRALVDAHVTLTGSARGRVLLDDWEAACARVWRVRPRGVAAPVEAGTLVR